MKTTEAQRSNIIFLHQEGISMREIAKRVGCSRKGVSGVIQRFQETGNTNDKPRSGRPRKSSSREDRPLVRLSLSDRKKSSSELTRDWQETNNVQVHPSTVRRRLIAAGLKGCKARKKPLVTEKQRRNRLKWAQQYKTWTVDQWKRVLFSDESTFSVTNHSGLQYVRRRQGEAFKPWCITPTVKHPASVMVWGCMAASGVGRLDFVLGMMNGEKYIKTMQTKMLPSARALFGETSTDWWYQDDNAPCHRAKKVKEWMQQERVSTLPWPAQSPDLNPIENLWQRMAAIINKTKPKTKKELMEGIVKAWHRVIEPKELEKLVSSMPKRCRLVIANKGWPIKY